MFGGLSRGAMWVVCALGVAAVHLLAWPGMIWLTRLQPDDAGINSSVALLTISLFAWMAAQGLLGSARTLQERGSLDLLLGSPLPARLVLASRALATAANSFGSAAILVLPAANIAAYLEGPGWLGAYPALLSLALVGTSIGLAVAIGLFLAFGARRARAHRPAQRGDHRRRVPAGDADRRPAAGQRAQRRRRPPRQLGCRRDPRSRRAVVAAGRGLSRRRGGDRLADRDLGRAVRGGRHDAERQLRPGRPDCRGRPGRCAGPTSAIVPPPAPGSAPA